MGYSDLERQCRMPGSSRWLRSGEKVLGETDMRNTHVFESLRCKFVALSKQKKFSSSKTYSPKDIFGSFGMQTGKPYDVGP